MTNDPDSQQPDIILASASPRRQLLFQKLGIPHRVIPAHIDERALAANTPREFALKAAFAKAGALDADVPEGAIIVAADTIVVLDGEIFFKPNDVDDARQMLSRLAGRTHHVITGLAVREARKATQLDAIKTDVHIKTLTPEEITDYIATGEPMDKAGSYGIQGLGGSLVQRITGDYFNVVGLPIDNLLQMLSVHTDTTHWQKASKALNPEIFTV